MTTSEMSPADYAAVANNNDGFGGNNGAWWIIILFLFAFRNGWGNGYGDNGGVANGYTLASDFATIQRQLSDGFGGVEKGLDTIRNGICDGFYSTAQQINGVNMNIAQNGYESRLATQTLGSQLASCCCDLRSDIAGVNYNLAAQANGISRQVERGFADTNYNLATQHCATLTAIDKIGDRIVDYLAAEKRQELRDENQALRLAASQAAQNNYIISQLKTPCPVPAYTVPNPNCCYGNFNGCGGCVA